MKRRAGKVLRSKWVQVKVSPEEHRELHAGAQRAGLSLSAWARLRLLELAREAARGAP